MIWLIVCIISNKESISQSFPDLQFEHITVKDGLSSNSVTSIIEDKHGFVWAGTANGLNRYDGYRFKQYYHSNTDSNSLVNNSVQRLYCDTRGRIWISTENGVSCFIPGQNKFFNYNTKQKPPYSLKNNSSVGVYEDEEGTIWLCNQLDVIYKVMPDLTLQELKIKIPAFQYYNSSPLGYDNIFRDKNEKEWAFTANRIYKINTVTKQPEKTFTFPDVLKGSVLKMMQTGSGKYFITTWGVGVWQFFPDENKLQAVATLPKRVFAGMNEWNYKKQKWMICLEANVGVYLLDVKTLTTKKYDFTAGDPSSIQGSVFNSFYKDKKENLWICSTSGINKVTAEQKIFDIIPITEPGTVNYQFDRAGSGYSFFETDSTIWLSKRYASTFEYDSAFQLKNFFNRLFPLSSALKYFANGFAYYFYNRQQELYISTDSGLIIYDLLKKTSTNYFPPQATTYTSFRTIIELNENEIMIRSSDKGIFVFNSSKKIFTRYYSNTGNCAECLPLRINYLFKTKNNEIYISTTGEAKGLLKLDRVSDKFKPVKPINDEKYGLRVSDLYGMDEDANGNLWITSTAGLFIYSPGKNIILEQKNDNDQIGGLSRICFDNYGNAWANGTSGIWCYLEAMKKWISFNGQDGLPGSEFDGVITRKNNGDIIAGLQGAIAVFHPERLTEQVSGYSAVITEAFTGKQLHSFALINGAGKKLTISPGKNSFTADFAVLNYLNPASSRYYYKLSPLMKEFQLNDNGHLNFNGLAPGQYTLYVKAGDKAGNIFEEGDMLEITVQPQWYQTNLFKILFLLALGGLIFYLVRRRIGTIRKEASFKQKIAETEMQALRAQMNPHFIFNSLNSIENFIMQNEKRLASDYLNKFARLIRMILDSSRNELTTVSKDMEALQLYVDLEQLRFNNKFAYNTIIDPALLGGDYKVPSLLIQPYVENAIVHGLAHSDRKDLSLTVTASLEKEKIRYVVLDNGVGREKAAGYNLQNKPQHKSAGLKITEDRISNFNNSEIKEGAVKFTDLYSPDNKPAGTRVEITIKAK